MTEIPLIAVQRIFNPSTGVPGDHTNFYYFEKKKRSSSFISFTHSNTTIILNERLRIEHLLFETQFNSTIINQPSHIIHIYSNKHNRRVYEFQEYAKLR